MSGLNIVENEISWEPEEGMVMPDHQESVRQEQKAMQLNISHFSLVDRDKDWTDVKCNLPNRFAQNKRINGGVDQALKSGNPTSKVFHEKHYANQQENIKTFLNAAAKFLGHVISILGPFIKFLLMIIFHLMGIKKIRKTRARRKNSNPRNKKRNSTSKVKKRPITNYPKMESKKAALNRNWNKVDTFFTPSSNLYCYWCTKKLGIKSWELDGHYYCDACYASKKTN